MKRLSVSLILLAVAGGCAKTDPTPQGGPAPATAPAGAAAGGAGATAGAGATTKPADYVEGRRPEVLVGRSASGREITVQRLPWATPGG